MGTGTKYYCLGCLRELEEYQLDPETGRCWECLENIEKNPKLKGGVYEKV